MRLPRPSPFLLAAILSSFALSAAEPNLGDLTTRATAAANAFLQTLDESSRSRAVFPYGDAAQRTNWSNLPTGIYQRAGIRLGALNDRQRTAALATLQASLSPRGYEKVLEIMTADQVLTDSSGSPKGIVFGTNEFYLSFVGAPSDSKPWTLQFGGHHLALNLTLAGTNNTLSPSLTATQPASYTRDGKTFRPLGMENDLAFRLIQSLDAAQRSVAILGESFHDLVLARRDEGLDIVQAEVGKSRRDAAEEMLDLLLVSRHYARDAQRLLRPRRHRGVLPLATGVVELHVPRGVVGVLSPWNYPLALVSGDVLPALVAGNAVLVKPDHRTTLTALWQVGLMHEAGVPRDVVRLVPGDGAVVGPLVVDRVDYVMFTGSTPVGRQVAARCGERLVGCSLELGGKNAMIVRADADVRKAAEIAVRGSFTNAGQLCISMERIYVHDAVYDTFVAALCDRVAALEFATGIGWGGTIGSLVLVTARTPRHDGDARDPDNLPRLRGFVRGGRPPPHLIPEDGDNLPVPVRDGHFCQGAPAVRARLNAGHLTDDMDCHPRLGRNLSGPDRSIP